ncbi:hypothetical protein [Streptomyces sp. NPDC050504]|uniref:hypothetical protein n=1 Tax=Streptomyces sp. NPDC050504 TaxID=3365618 RepID=UPI0037BB4A3C
MRRRVLIAGGTGVAAAALLTGCGGSGPGSDGSSGSASAAEAKRRRAAGAEAALRGSAARTSGALLARYDAARAAHPALAARIAPLRAAAAEHLKALAAPRNPSPVRTPPPAADRRAALRELADAARRTSDAHTAALLDAPPELARLLASVAAACAAHAHLLSEGAPA